MGLLGATSTLAPIAYRQTPPAAPPTTTQVEATVPAGGAVPGGQAAHGTSPPSE